MRELLEQTKALISKGNFGLIAPLTIDSMQSENGKRLQKLIRDGVIPHPQTGRKRPDIAEMNKNELVN